MAQSLLRAAHSDSVKQFSVFAENKVGRLNDLVLLLAAHDVHIMALSLVDTTDSTVIRLVVDYPEQATKLFKDHGFAHNTVDVVAIEIDHEQQFRTVTCALVQAEINIHYIYPFLMRPRGKTGLVLRLEDHELASDVLRQNQVTVLSQSDIAR
jgi:hypothetical protein